MTLMVIVINIVILFLIRVSSAKDTLHLGVLISQEGDLDLSGYIPAMDLVLESIKNDTSLPFEFNVTLNDSMVRVTTRVVLQGPCCAMATT